MFGCVFFGCGVVGVVVVVVGVVVVVVGGGGVVVGSSVRVRGVGRVGRPKVVLAWPKNNGINVERIPTKHLKKRTSAVDTYNL